MPHMEGIFINGEKAKFHPEDILDTNASQYTEEIGESVTAFLTEHLTNPPIDTSLSIAGAAADAKKTGDEISELKEDTTQLMSDIDHIEGSICKKYTIVDLTETGSYIHPDGTIRPTPLKLATSPMIPVDDYLKEIVLKKNSPTMTGYSIGFYRTNLSTGSDSFIDGYVADFTEGTASVTPPAGTKYIAFCSRSNAGYEFNATLLYTIADTLSEVSKETAQNTSAISSTRNEIEMLSYYTFDEEQVIDKPDSTSSITKPSNIFAFGNIFNQGYYSAKFYSDQPVTLYVFAVDDLSDTSLELKSTIVAESENGVVTFKTFYVGETSIVGFAGKVGYKASPNAPYYLVSYTNDEYTKPASPSGNVVFNTEVKKTIKKVPDGVGIPYIAQTSDTLHIKLIGDSITQGSGSTGYVEFILNGLTYRGNAPDYPDAGSGYQVGKFLGSYGAVRWYEAIDGSGWGQIIKAYFEEKFNCVVKNYGMGGATTQNVLTLWDNIIDADDDIVVVMLGTNDRRDFSIDTYYANLTTIVTKLILSGKKVIVMSPPPILPSVDVNSQYFHLEDACNNSSAVAFNKGCNFIDNFGYINEYCELKGVALSTLLRPDGVHPNDDGYRVLFNNIVKCLGLGRKVDGATW